VGSPAEDDGLDPIVTVVNSAPPVAAEIDLHAKGDAGAVRDAMETMAGGAPPEAPASRPVPPEDRIDELLTDPRNMVIVTRILPRKWMGQKVDVFCDKWQCPISRTDLEDDVFARFGGKRFKVNIHPNTPNGENKIVGGYSFTNRDLDEPVNDGIPYDDDGATMQMQAPMNPAHMTANDVDPTMGPSTRDPMAVARAAIARKTDMLRSRAELREAQESLEELENYGRRKQPGGPDPRDGEIRSLEAKISRMENQQMAGMNRPDSTLPLILEMIKSSQAQFSAMMAAMSASQAQVLSAAMGRRSGSEENNGIDAQLDRLTKMREAFGGNEDRVKRVEELLFDLAMDKLNGNSGRDPAEDDDPIKYTVKQAIPVFKQYLERQMEKEKTEGAPVSEERLRSIYSEAAKNAASQLAKKWESEGKIVRAPQQNQPQPSAPPREEHKKEPEMKTTPGPTAPGYDRRASVDFVLTTIVTDAKRGCPDDTFAVGDILDRLDDDLLERFVTIETTEQLNALLREFATPALVDALGEIGKDERIKGWIKRIVITAQDEYRKSRESAK
jgi:hypothetical protein